jgi:hypothetical protein
VNNHTISKGLVDHTSKFDKRVPYYSETSHADPIGDEIGVKAHQADSSIMPPNARVMVF